MTAQKPPAGVAAATDSRQRPSRSPSLRPTTMTERAGVSSIVAYQGRAGETFPPCVSAQACFIVAITILEFATFASPSTELEPELRRARNRCHQDSSSMVDHAPYAPWCFLKYSNPDRILHSSSCDDGEIL